jgi:hypothetical protein
MPAAPAVEIPNDDIDGNCNGWADELGFGIPADDAASLVLVNGQYDGLGSDLATGLDADGVPWLAIGAQAGIGAEKLPGDGALDVWMDGWADNYDDWGVAVGNGEGSLLGRNGSELSAWTGTGFLRPEDAIATLENRMTTMAVGDLDGDGLDDLATVGYPGLVEVFGAPVDGSWGASRLTVSSGGFGVNTRSRMVVADLTGDGLLEMLAFEHNTHVLWVLPGDAGGAFVPEDVGWMVAAIEDHPSRRRWGG